MLAANKLLISMDSKIIDSKVCCEKGAERGKIYYAFDGHSISNKIAEFRVPKKMLPWCYPFGIISRGFPKKIKIRNHLSLLPSYADLLKPKQHNTIVTKV